MSETETKRPRGRPRLSTDELRKRGTYRADRHQARWIEEHPDEAALPIWERYPMAPRRRVMLGENPDLVLDELREQGVDFLTDGPWLAGFAEEFCVQSIGRWAGKPLIYEGWQRSYFNDALAFLPDGERIYTTGLLGIPRKNGKTTGTSGGVVAISSPLEGEGKPLGILAAGSLKQANPLFDQAVDFAVGDPTMRAVFETMKSAIVCEENGGKIERVVGDGKLNHGLNPYFIGADELHAWTTPKQRENWAALTTADGARDDALLWVLSTAGWDLESLLGELYTQAWNSPHREMRPDMGGGGFVVRDRDAKLLVHWYAVASNTLFDDIDEFKRANPASWRTPERIARDLAKRHIDEPTKRRLYGNEWTSAKDRWIAHDRWAATRTDALPPEKNVYYGVDVGLTGDTTAVAWAWPTGDGKIALRARVWSAKSEFAHHFLSPGGKVDLEVVERYIIDELIAKHGCEEIAYDPRFFVRSAEIIDAEADVILFPVWQNSGPMADAYQAFYDAVERDLVVLHEEDPVLDAHVAAAAGVKGERGWKVSKLKSTNKIDALVASVMAVYRALQAEGDVEFVSWDDVDALDEPEEENDA